MRRGTGKLTRISMKPDDCARCSMKCGLIFTLAAWKNCRDRQDAPAFLEGFQKIAGVGSKSRAGEVCNLETRSFSSIAWIRRAAQQRLCRPNRKQLSRGRTTRGRHNHLVLDRDA